MSSVVVQGNKTINHNTKVAHTLHPLLAIEILLARFDILPDGFLVLDLEAI